MPRPALLSDEIRLEILNKYYNSTLTIRDIAKLFKTSHMTIYRIVSSPLAKQLYPHPRQHAKSKERRPLSAHERINRAQKRLYNKLIADTPREQLIDPATGKTLAQLDEDKLTDAQRQSLHEQAVMQRWGNHKG